MTSARTLLSSRAEQTTRDLSTVLLITQSTARDATSLCEILPFAQDDGN
jgi:hypothetical protein